ncbi:MAG: carboxypeptidase-like regulatory domain-containing protein [Isosphaeraceae bacterium]
MLLVPALLALLPLACGGGGPEMGSVSGKVTYKSQPLTKGTITFVSQKGGRNATGQIGSDGTYTLQTENPGDGAEVGDYKVTISAKEEQILDYIPPKPVPPKYLAPEKFEKPDTSGLTAAVKSGRNTFDFNLTD